MNSITIFAVLLLFYQIEIITPQQNVPSIIDIGQAEDNLNETVNDVLKFGTNVINTLAEKVNTLPPNMKTAGQNILVDAREGLQSCESAFMRNGTAWEYKVCCSDYLKNGMIAFGNLSAEIYRSAAGKQFTHSTICYIISCFLVFVNIV